MINQYSIFYLFSNGYLQFCIGSTVQHNSRKQISYQAHKQWFIFINLTQGKIPYIHVKFEKPKSQVTDNDSLQISYWPDKEKFGAQNIDVFLFKSKE